MKDEATPAIELSRAALVALREGCVGLVSGEAGILVLFSLPTGDTGMASNIEKNDVICALEALIKRLKGDQN